MLRLLIERDEKENVKRGAFWAAEGAMEDLIQVGLPAVRTHSFTMIAEPTGDGFTRVTITLTGEQDILPVVPALEGLNWAVTVTGDGT